VSLSGTEGIWRKGFFVIKIFKSKQFVLFLLAGGTAALVNFASRFLYNSVTSFELAVVLAYFTGMITAFLLNKFFVFEKSGHRPIKEFYYFTLVNVIAVVQTYAISVGLANYILPAFSFKFYPEAVAHAFGVAFPVFTSFWGHKYLSFKRSNNTEEK